MDTDIENECREIVIRRKDAQDRLKKIDKELKKLPLQSPRKMQDMAGNVSTAFQVEMKMQCCSLTDVKMDTVQNLLSRLT